MTPVGAVGTKDNIGAKGRETSTAPGLSRIPLKRFGSDPRRPYGPAAHAPHLRGRSIRQYLTACHELFKFLLEAGGVHIRAVVLPTTRGRRRPGAERGVSAVRTGGSRRLVPYHAQTKGKVRPIRIRESSSTAARLRMTTIQRAGRALAGGHSVHNGYATTGERPDLARRRAVLPPWRTIPIDVSGMAGARAASGNREGRAATA